MLHTKFRFIWPSGFRGIIFFRNRPIRNNFYFFLLLSAKLEIVVPGSGISFSKFPVSRHLLKLFYGIMTAYAVFLPSLLSISTKS
jgi:hypothetical protein